LLVCRLIAPSFLPSRQPYRFWGVWPQVRVLGFKWDNENQPMTQQPNTFIIGAPKSGTTALFHYLSQHPQVFSTHPKEPRFFATDLPGSRFVTDLKHYTNLFKDAQPQHQVLCEGSVFYLYSQEALANIKSFNPGSRLIAMFRNPADLVYSFHSELLYGREESEPDFATAWGLSSLRKQGQSIPKHNREPKLLFYDDIAKHGHHLERLLGLFPEDQVLVIFFDDFAKNTEATYQQTLEFLGLPFHAVDLSPVNENKQHRNPRFADFIQRPPPFMLTPYLKAKKWLGLDGKYLNLRQPFLQANTVITKREKLSPELRQKILEAYEPDITKLARLTGRNLEHWLAIKEKV
jgi:Sulfotransferase domain